MSRQVLLYELNEVPWEVVDLYVAQRPQSALAELLASGLSLTTVCDDAEPLQPWRTWPTFHTSMYTSDHNSFDLGQHPNTFRGDAIWDVADRAGKAVGVFGPMQSWPARTFAHGGFYVPDTFARTPETVPTELQRFQAFNLTMTRENTFNPDSRLLPRQLVGVLVDLLHLGLTAKSALGVARHLVDEWREPRYKASRSIMQALPAFDLYWRLHKQCRPDLSIFFTNHVAGMMHRYWGDSVPGYTSAGGYTPDPIFGTFLSRAMDVFDAQLRRLLEWTRQHPATVLLLASSMGQFAIDKESVDETFVLNAPGTLMSALGLQAEVGSAMYPRTSLLFQDPSTATAAAVTLKQVRTSQRELFSDIRVIGSSISFAIDQTPWGRPRTEEVTYPYRHDQLRAGSLQDLGVNIRQRMGGGNTAYHVPNGVFVAHGSGIPQGNDRDKVSILDAAPSILASLGIPAPRSYQGSASIPLS